MSALTEDPTGLVRDLVGQLRGADLTTLDLVLLALLFLTVLGGLRAGLVSRATRLAGLALGLLALGVTVPAVLSAIDPDLLAVRAGLAVAVAAGTVAAVTTGGILYVISLYLSIASFIASARTYACEGGRGGEREWEG